jgi:hypothetical protein
MAWAIVPFTRRQYKPLAKALGDQVAPDLSQLPTVTEVATEDGLMEGESAFAGSEPGMKSRISLSVS